MIIDHQDEDDAFVGKCVVFISKEQTFVFEIMCV